MYIVTQFDNTRLTEGRTIMRRRRRRKIYSMLLGATFKGSIFFSLKVAPLKMWFSSTLKDTPPF